MVSSVETLKHDHNHGGASSHSEARTRWVVALTCAMMFGELSVGYLTNSLALTADGWHMATHALALGMAWFAYRFARMHSRDSSFSFGTGKVHALAGYTSAIILAVVALWMISESARRLLDPHPIAFGEALPVAVLGLLVNLASVKLLHAGQHDLEHSGHGHDHNSHDDHDHHDHNLRAAYMHVFADAFTSVLAILALLGGRYLDWTFLDPLMGIVGGVVIARWSLNLCGGAAKQLLDMVPSPELLARIRERLESRPGTEVVDLHLWDIGPNARACIASVVSTDTCSPQALSEELRRHEGLQHVTVELHRATD